MQARCSVDFRANGTAASDSQDATNTRFDYTAHGTVVGRQPQCGRFDVSTPSLAAPAKQTLMRPKFSGGTLGVLSIFATFFCFSRIRGSRENCVGPKD